MAKNYTVVFGTGDTRGYTGLSPTFLIFWNLATGASNAPPSITETIVGKTGMYTFSYGTTQPINFLIDAATTSPGPTQRYVSGQIDPNDRIDEVGSSLIALGTTMVAIGTTQIGQGTTLTAIGFSTLVYGSSLISLGNTSVALGTTAVALGTTQIGQGVTLTAIGNSTLVYGSSLIALGNTNVALGTSNIALGTSNIALGTTAVAGINAFGSTFSGANLTLIALGTTSVALGTSSVALGNFIGSTASSFGSTAIDPTTLFGFMMRNQEIQEGKQTYTKSTGILDLFTRGATLLREKTITDTSTTTTKS